VQQVARGIGLDKRISPTFLHAGPGYGGSCFPKDTKALAQTAKAADVPLTLVDATIAANAGRKHRLASIIDGFTGGVGGKTLALLGLTFKPNTDDMRGAPAIPRWGYSRPMVTGPLGRFTVATVSSDTPTTISSPVPPKWNGTPYCVMSSVGRMQMAAR